MTQLPPGERIDFPELPAERGVVREKIICAAMARLDGITNDLTKTAEVLRETFGAVIDPGPDAPAIPEAQIQHRGSEHGKMLMNMADRLEESLTRITAIIGSVDI
jgi:hypothetical protein